MSPATGQTDPTSSSRSRRSAHPTGRGFDVRSLRMASISLSAMSVFLFFRLEQPTIDPGLGALDRHRANGLCVELGWPHAADDGVAKSLLLHRFEAVEQQRLANPMLSFVRVDARGPEEIGAGRVMAGKTEDALLPDGDEAGDRLAGKRD